MSGGRLGRVPFLAVTACGLGCMRPASGTWGSLPPVVLAAGMLALGTPLWQVHASVVLLGVAGAVACLRFGAAAEAAFGGKDPGRVVADEVAGQAIVVAGLPLAWLQGPPLAGGLSGRQAAALAAAFVLFRVMDVVKPPPAAGLQRIRGGAGILVDDLVAGAYALAALWLLGPLLGALR